MGSRPTIADLAAAAGVSTATVDRVLNGRQKVREETARRVYDAARDIGYHAAGLIRMRMQEALPTMRFGFVLHKPDHYFYQDFESHLAAAVEGSSQIQGRSEFAWVRSGTATEFAEQIERMARRCDAVAAVSADLHQVNRAVGEAKARGVPVYSMLSDFAQGIRVAYFGTNNLKVGRCAAWLVARMARRPGKVGLFVGGQRWHGHQLRETGFRSYFRENAPDFEVIESVTNLETRQVTYEATLTLLRDHPDLIGFYCAGGGMEGALLALREEGRGPELSVVVNEVTPDTVAALQEGIVTAVLATPLREMCQQLVQTMIRTVSEGMEEMTGQVFVPVRLHIPESV